MKLADKRFRILLVMIANTVVVFAQSVFSVEEISKAAYMKAEKERLYYNVIPADSIVDNDIVNLVLKECQAKFERLDSAARQNIYEVNGEEQIVFDKRQLLYIPELNLYGFPIPETPFDSSVWWFDAESGKYMCSAAYPTAINVSGMYVSQVGHDCDWVLELRFFHRKDNCFYEFEFYRNTRYNGETVACQEENSKLNPIFWYGSNLLFLKTYDYENEKYVYLKIKVR